jgi:hypothetical protein
LLFLGPALNLSKKLGAGDSRFVKRVSNEVGEDHIPFFSRRPCHAESLRKFPADTFEQYLTNVTSDGILLIEV